MIEYRNKVTGRVYSRPGPDEWLEASDGWERVESPEPAAKDDDKKESD